MRKNCFVESAILYPKTVKLENLKKIADAQFSLALPHILCTCPITVFDFEELHSMIGSWTPDSAIIEAKVWYISSP